MTSNQRRTASSASASSSSSSSGGNVPQADRNRLKQRSNTNHNNANNKIIPSKRKGQRPFRQPSPYPNVQAFANDKEQTRELVELMQNLGLYDSHEGLNKRQEALNSLEELLNDWSTSISSKSTARVALISFGSYRLRVHKPDADMDLLALCPTHCSRHAFFTSLVERLKSDDANVKDVHPISAAYTPVIKFTYQGIPIDLLFARLENETKLRESRPKGTLYTIDDSDLFGLDEGSVRSLNGARVGQLLDQSVPDLGTFRTTLRAVKEWAHVHGLYSNVMGFLGGINYALLVACICRRNANATPVTLLKAFFQTYAQWSWPTPVIITSPHREPPAGVKPLPVWSANTNPRDRMHLMPILTPTYPSMNSAYNVGVPQLRRLVQAFQSAATTLTHIEAGNKTWMDLFQGKQEFFSRHEHFLQVNIMASNGADFLEWFRFVESRLRLLIAGLDNPHYGVQAEPFCQFYDRTYDRNGKCLGPGKSPMDNKTESCLYIALRFRQVNAPVDLTYLVADFLHKINTWDGRGMGMDVTMEMVKRPDLKSPFLMQEKQKVKSPKEDKSPKEAPPPPAPLGPEDDASSSSEEASSNEEVSTEEAPPVMSWAMKVRGDNNKAARIFVSPAKRART
jgi:poly(A) polymerase